MKNCKACIFFEDLKIGRGICRRYPPKVFAEVTGDLNDIQTTVNSFFPEIEFDDWCGEFVESLQQEENEK